MHCNLSQRAIVNTNESIWYSAPYPGIWFSWFEADDLVQKRPLTFSEKVWIERWRPGTQLPNIIASDVKEIFVLEGT